jgi:tRNA splicing endonuclease
MTNHPNRGKRKFILIRGTTMTNGYRDDRLPEILRLTLVNGRWYEWDFELECPDLRDGYEAYYYIDSEGWIVIKGAKTGSGFLPDPGELARFESMLIHLPRE